MFLLLFTDRRSDVPTYRANDVGYLATIQMGTPPQNFLLLMDSGSADLWVGAENCVSDAGGNCVSGTPIACRLRP